MFRYQGTGLNEMADEFSQKYPWESKDFVVVWRGKTTGFQDFRYPFPDPRFNARVSLFKIVCPAVL